MVAEQVLDAYDFSRHTCLMDVGGGHGAFLAEVAQRLSDHDAYRLGGEGRVELYASANNVFNKKAPIAATFSPYYDVIGRYVTVGARMRV